MTIDRNDLLSFSEASEIYNIVASSEEAHAIVALECISYLLLNPEHELSQSIQSRKIELFEAIRETVWKK